MGKSEKYKPWLTLTTLHEYYVRASCPVSIEPSPETDLIFRKHNMLFIKQQGAQWKLYVENEFDPNDLLINEYKLIFALYPQSEKFYYLSENPTAENDAFTLHEAPLSKAWKNVELNLRHIINSDLQKIDIVITSPERYLEYICIPKYHSVNTKLRLTEERNRMTFHEEEFQPIAAIETAFRFVSTEKIKLSEDYNLKMQLWEIRESGERLISHSIPNPQPNELSLTNPKDTITTYFYY